MSAINRLQTNDLEIGVTDAVVGHVSRQVVQRKPVSQRTLDLEHARPRWLRECMAEATGTFFYVYPGIASIASFTLNLENPVGVTAFGSIFQIGWAFAVGIAFAIITCASTSGGHFNPAITIALALWQGFPWKKVPYYIFSQIFGAFVAGLLLMGMYWPEIQAANEQFLAAGKPLVANGAPASILCSFPNPNQTNLGYVFMTEFFVDSFIGIIIWSCLDPANVSRFLEEFSLPLLPKRSTTFCLCSLSQRTLCTIADPLIAFCVTIRGTVYHRSRLRKHGLGIRRYNHLHQPRKRPGNEARRFDLLRPGSIHVHGIRPNRYSCQHPRDPVCHRLL